MWEVIENNKRKSMVALFLAAVWYCLVYGFICGFFVFAFLDYFETHGLPILTNLGFVITKHIAPSTTATDSYAFNSAIILCYVVGILVSLLIFLFNYKSKKDKPYYISGSHIYRADYTKNKYLYNILEEIAIASGQAKIPKLYILDSPIMNAYACGMTPEKSSIVISKALIERLSRDELQGVIAHEMSHIINRDTTYLLCSGLLFIIAAGFTAVLFRSLRGGSGKGKGFILILALISLVGQGICFIMFMLISRKREYLADACASQYTRYPKGLADALMKIENFYSGDADIKAHAYRAYSTTANINNLVKASFIVPASKGNDSLTSTHPSTQNRIKVLLNMTSADFKAYEREFKKLNKDSIIPKSSLKDSKEIAIKNVKPANVIAPTVAMACAIDSINADKQILQENKEILDENIVKHRQVEDMVRDLAGYKIIKCNCETILKVPPCYKNTIVICPHCKKKHEVV